jgi:hypothetical protein
MARDCFCGCGRKVERRHKGLDKRAAELRVVTQMLESHVLVFQRAFTVFAARGDHDADEVAEAREGVATTEELIETSLQGQEQIADVIHGNELSAFDERDLKDLVRHLMEMDAKVRKTCFQLGLDYKKIPELGPEGIAAFVEAQDGRARP